MQFCSPACGPNRLPRLWGRLVCLENIPGDYKMSLYILDSWGVSISRVNFRACLGKRESVDRMGTISAVAFEDRYNRSQTFKMVLPCQESKSSANNDVCKVSFTANKILITSVLNLFS